MENDNKKTRKILGLLLIIHNIISIIFLIDGFNAERFVSKLPLALILFFGYPGIIILDSLFIFTKKKSNGTIKLILLIPLIGFTVLAIMGIMIALGTH